MGNYAVKGTKEPEDSSLEQHIEELNNEIKLRESSLASRFQRTNAPKNQISCASIVAAINNRSETDSVEFNTLKSELLVREVHESITLDRFLELMELYIQRSRLTTRLVEQTEQAKAEREGGDVSSTDRMKPFGDHRMFVHMQLEGMHALAKVLPRRGRDEPMVKDDKVTREAKVAPEVTKNQVDEEYEVLYK